MDRTKGHVQDILDAIALIQKHTQKLTPEDFIDGKNILVQNLAMRHLQLLERPRKN